MRASLRRYYGPKANDAVYENKIHLRELDELRPICSTKTGYYRPVQITLSVSKVTCQRCIIGMRVRGIK